MNNSEVSRRDRRCLPFKLPDRQTLIICILVQVLFGSIPVTVSDKTSQASFNGLITDAPSFVRPFATSGNYYYQAISVSVSANGFYNLSVWSVVDTVGCLYFSDFKPSQPVKNLIECKSAAARSTASFMNTSFATIYNFILIITTDTAETIGDFTLFADGPGQLYFSAFSSTTQVMTKPTQLKSSSQYTNTLSIVDQTFLRPYGGGLRFNYKLIRISIFSNGYYKISGQSAIYIYGVLYENSFSSQNPSQNIVANSYNVPADTQFMINMRLQSGGVYFLVITTYASNSSGSFTITADGPEQVSFDLIASNTATYSSSLSSNDEVFARPQGTGRNYYYKAISIAVPMRGTYTITSSSNIDTWGFLYNNLFDASSPSQNLVTFNDDSGGNNQFKITTTLQSSTAYVLVVTTHGQYTSGNFLVKIDGPSQVTFSTFAQETVRYSNMLSISSPKFIRSGRSSSYFYYQAILVTVPVSGRYFIKSDSTIDTYGCLYTDSFDPSYPNSAITCDDDSGGSGQFLFNYNLQSTQTYILVVTTYSVSITGYYTVIASGPGSLRLTSTTRTTSRPIFTTTECKYSWCRSSKSTSTLTIVGIVLGSIGGCIILLALVARCNSQQTASTRNRVAHVRESNARPSDRSFAPYTIPMPASSGLKTEGLPPSYDDYLASLKQTHPDDTVL